MLFRFVAALVLAAFPTLADTPCSCDPANPETLKERQCSLCIEAEKQPPDVDVFFLKDINPRKPNRTLALPRVHTLGLHPLAELPRDVQVRFLTAAIDKAKSLWGDDWAIAYNGDRVRTQCHAHIHIGKLLPGVEAGEVVVVNSVAEIPIPKDTGFWVHPSGGKLHVHTGEQIAETVLLR